MKANRPKPGRRVLPKPRPKIAQFTLVELLVVVAIIGILMSILLPALKNVKEKAKGIICASNLKQVATTCAMYSADYNNWMPGGGNVSDVPGPAWTSALADYLEDNASLGYPHTVFGNKLLLCASNRSSRFTTYGPIVGRSTGYGMCAGGMRSATPQLCKTTLIRNASAIPYWGEIDNSLYNHSIINDMAASTLGYKYSLYANIHAGQSNIAFSDGRVMSIPYTEWVSTGPVGHPWGYHFAIDWAKPSW